MNETKDFGIQPLEGLMARFHLTNHDLVAASREQLTHKMVAKGRKGKKLTPNVQQKILSALKAARPEEGITREDLFNY